MNLNPNTSSSFVEVCLFSDLLNLLLLAVS